MFERLIYYYFINCQDKIYFNILDFYKTYHKYDCCRLKFPCTPWLYMFFECHLFPWVFVSKCGLFLIYFFDYELLFWKQVLACFIILSVYVSLYLKTYFLYLHIYYFFCFSVRYPWLTLVNRPVLCSFHVAFWNRCAPCWSQQCMCAELLVLCLFVLQVYHFSIASRRPSRKKNALQSPFPIVKKIIF